ncbi:hypothetical protein [Planctomonas deserti]|uniref:hypothetical protein n=1 Tax=Planctomonas deserti TaxID=2144185 RepID=UPI001F0BF233|nr:hypothetical protein [Planctomonas deserti]
MGDERGARPEAGAGPVAVAAGRLIAAVFAGLKLVRPVRPIHPQGVALTGVLERTGTAVPSGITWVDAPGHDAVAGRVSRSIGLPHALPDIVGLALRLEGGPGGDLFLASTGFGVPSRYLLRLLLRADRARYTTLLPYRGGRGAVLIGARTLTAPPLPARPRELADALSGGEWVLGMYHARPLGRWHRFGTLTLRLESAPGDLVADGGLDTDRRLDPMLHVLPGAAHYPWIAAVREPAYRVARRRRA